MTDQELEKMAERIKKIMTIGAPDVLLAALINAEAIKDAANTIDKALYEIKSGLEDTECIPVI